MSKRKDKVWIPHAAEIARMRLLLERSGAAALLEEGIRRDSRGRRREVSGEAMLALLGVALVVYKSARAQRLHEVLHKLLPIEVLDWLGLTRADGQPVSHTQIDYFFRTLNRSYSSSTLRFRKQPLTEAERERNREEFTGLINRVATGWIPPDLPTGDLLALDTTALESTAKPLKVELREALEKEESGDLLLNAERALPIEQQKHLQRQRAHRAVEARWGYHTATYAAPRKKIGGFHIHTCVSGPLVGDDAPELILQFALTPASGYYERDMARMLLGRISEQWGDHHVVVADKAYSQAIGFWEDLRRSGRRFALDLDESQLHPRGAHGGAILAQGNALCPGTPDPLRNPGKRPLAYVRRGTFNPQRTAWTARVQAQQPFHARVRSRRDNGMNVSCPYPHVDCIIKAPLDPEGRRPVVLNPPHMPLDLCRQQTVWIPDTQNPFRQTMPWGSKRWAKTYSRGRALIEGAHGRMKHPDGQDLRRWIGGAAATQKSSA